MTTLRQTMKGWAWVAVPTAFLFDQEEGGNLTNLDLKVYIVLLGYKRKKESGETWPERERLAAEVGCTKRAVQRSVARLIENGWVDRITVKRGSKTKPGFRVYDEKQARGVTLGSPNISYTRDPRVTPPVTLGSPHITKTSIQTSSAEATSEHQGDLNKYKDEERDLYEEGEPASQARQDSLHPSLQEEKEDQGDQGVGGVERRTAGADESLDVADVPASVRAEIKRGQSKAPPPPRRPVTDGNKGFTPPPKTLPVAQWPPQGGRDVYYKWGEEVVARHAGYRVPHINASAGKDATLAKQLGERFDADALLHIIRIAIWDWSAIQETIDPWYTKEAGPVPTLQHILKLAPQLAARIEKGVISTSHRVSEYHSKFIEPETSASKDGVSFAERMRNRTHAERVGKRRSKR